ncbi:MAG: SPOR domain-containing protein [Archangium sp.]|nr:SPOR domain-containing protein [Archangium sp.]MDP3152916.1 SPOR domain-containing protein [Archangium sp.]MDP3569926.1 SPOR domain-containing protein [Archangium sp.]
MRDSHRLKEKYELSLDNRQIVSITVASLVVLGGVFMLGVVVGKKLSAETAAIAQQPTDLLGQLDRKTEALENMKADAAFTFQDELTRKAPAPVVDAPIVAPAPKPEPVAVAPPAPRLEDASVPEVAVVTPKPVPLPETPRVDSVATRTVDGGGLKEAFGKVQAQRPPTETVADGSWTVQLSAYQDKTEADRFAAGLRDKGYAPFIVEARIPGKGTWYRVRMGRFGSRDAASRYMEDFRRETSMNAIVTTAN